ncbi:MAG: fibronectin type III domain-containing protein [Gemmataceae bacterium]
MPKCSVRHRLQRLLNLTTLEARDAPHSGPHYDLLGNPAGISHGPFLPPDGGAIALDSLLGGPAGPLAPGAVTWTAAANGMPQLASRPSAPTAIYLDFDGDGTNSAYDTNGNTAVFDATEQGVIVECWRQISIYFAMFDVNVTTVKPPTTTPTAWALESNSISGGYSYVGVFPNNSPQSFNQSSNARDRISGIAHELGHNFGLSHQSDYDGLGVKTNEYSSGPDTLNGPIMGVDYAQNVHRFYVGHPSGSGVSLQDDFLVIANKIKPYQPTGGDGYVADEHFGTPTTMLEQDGAFLGWGTIERLTDVDSFALTTTGGRWGIYGNALTPSSLDVKIEVFDAAGNRIATADGATNDQTLILDLPAGNYTINVSGHGDYGDQGAYHLSARPLPDGWTSQVVGTTIAAGYAGFDPADGTWHVAGSGNALTGTGDTMRFAYVPLTGDGSITARVVDVENTNASARVGVAIRENATGGSRSVAMTLTPTQAVWIARTTTGGTPTSTSNAGAAPRWVRITRVGNLFTGQVSADGVTWTTINTSTIAMSTNTLIGLVVTSNNSSQVNSLNESTLDSVTVTGTTGTAAPTYNGLSAPTGLTATLGTGTDVTLTWLAATGATGYALDRSSDNVTWTQVVSIGSGTTTTYTVTGLGGAQRWFFRIAATMTGGSRSVPSDVATIVNRPAAPTSVNTESISQTQIVVNWIETSGETGYRVERSADGGTTWVTAGSVGANVPSFNNTGLTVGTTYQYRVIPTSADGDSPASATVTESTRLAVVGGFARTALTSTSASFLWTAVANSTGYRVERSVDGGTTWSVLTTTTDLATTDDTLTPLTEYAYRVVAVNAFSESSAASSVLLFATPAAAALPLPWSSIDIGTVAGPGATSLSGTTWTVAASGTSVTTTADSGHFAYQPLYGDGTVVTRVASIETGGAPQVGIMVRESTANNARFVAVTLAPIAGNQTTNNLNFLRRTSTGGTPANTAITNLAAPLWLRLTRVGNVFTAEQSADGTTWTVAGTATVTLPTNVLAGLFATAGSTSTIITGTFDSVAVTSSNPPAFVSSSTPTASAAGPVSFIDVTFNRSMDTTSFAIAADIIGFSGPTGSDLRPLVTSYSWTTAQTLRINFTSLTVPGLYTLTLGPQILTAAGVALDSNVNGTPGEAADGFATTLRIGPAPDGFDYAVATGTADANWNITPTTGGVVTLSAINNNNDAAVAIDLGTNVFRFYGTNYTGTNNLFVSSNGLITLSGTLAGGANGDLTSAPSLRTIAPMWDNLVTNRNTTTDDVVLYQFRDLNADGTPDRLIVAWRNVHYAGGTNTTDDGITFQAVLSLNTGATSGDVLFNYTDLAEANGGSQNNAAGATVGIKDTLTQGTRRQLVGLNGSASTVVASGRSVRLFVNTAPTATAGGPYTLTTSGTVTLAGTRNDADGTVVAPTILWDLDGDGIFGETGSTANRGDEVGTTPTFRGQGLVGPSNFIVRARTVDEYGRISTDVTAPVAIPAPPRVSQVIVGDGSPQRSRIESLTIKFSTVVQLPANAASAFRLDGPGGSVALIADTSLSTATQTIVKLTFGRLADGRYTLTILSSATTDAIGQMLDGDNDGLAGVDSLMRFHRFYGDLDGDGDVDGSDLFAFIPTPFNPTNYIAALDSDGDGDIDGTEVFEFAQRMFSILP